MYLSRMFNSHSTSGALTALFSQTQTQNFISVSRPQGHFHKCFVSTGISQLETAVEKKAERNSAPAEPVAVITLRTRAPRKKVVWTEDTVDNEHMNKKKSKCCCIYEKPKKFGESDSEDSDDECEHCFGHVEKRHAKHATATAAGTVTTTDVLDAPAPEPTATITLAPAPAPAPAPPDDKHQE